MLLDSSGAKFGHSSFVFVAIVEFSGAWFLIRAKIGLKIEAKHIPCLLLLSSEKWLLFNLSLVVVPLRYVFTFHSLSRCCPTKICLYLQRRRSFSSKTTTHCSNIFRKMFVLNFQNGYWTITVKSGKLFYFMVIICNNRLIKQVSDFVSIILTLQCSWFQSWKHL